MKLDEIQHKIDLAHAYKYISELELEKSKRNSGIFHDFTDVDTFHKQQVNLYKKYIKRYHKMRLDKIGRNFNFIVTGSHLFLIAMLFSLLI
ncbi:hypothetical protein KY321_03400 [Candidatus Woesearchaeota archaeon]|nr:hypothetical protein [Candidatus Woesearchaeota archaeon]